MDFDLNKFLRESIGDVNYFFYDVIAWLSNFFSWLKR